MVPFTAGADGAEGARTIRAKLSISNSAKNVTTRRGKTAANAIHKPTQELSRPHQTIYDLGSQGLDARGNERLEPFCGAKLSDNGSYVALIAVNLEVHSAHVLDRNLPTQLCQAGAQPRDAFKGVATHHRHRIVWREIPQVVFQRNETQRFDQPVSGISCNNVHFLLGQRTIKEPEIQLAGWLAEFQAVALGPAFIAIRTFQKFVTHAGTPLRGERHDIRNLGEMILVRIFLAYHHRKSILEAKWLGHLKVEPLGVLVANPAVYGLAIAGLRLPKNREKRGARIFDVQVQIAVKHCFMHQKGATKIGLSFDGDASTGFYVLREKLRQDNLLGKKL